MYHMSHIINDEYSKKGETARDKVNKTNKGTEQLYKTVKGSNVVLNKNYTQEKDNKFSKNNSKISLDISKLNMQNNEEEIEPSITSREHYPKYIEFADKLDSILEKVKNMAQSSEDVSINNLGELQNLIRNKSQSSMNSKITSKDKKCDSNTIAQKITETVNCYAVLDINCADGNDQSHSIFETPLSKKPSLKTQFLTDAMLDNGDGPLIPPIMNNDIKYIKIGPKEFKKSKSSLYSGKKDSKPVLNENESKRNINSNKFEAGFSQETIIESLEFDSYIKPDDPKDEIEQDTFKILISGHLTKDAPVFIVHKNYVETSSLIKDTVDFKTQKSKGNVDIVLTGKFFHKNILMKNNRGQPSALDLTSHKLLIDRRSTVAPEKFKHTFHLGRFDAILEGEFVANSETLQYIPLFSLEVVKHKSTVKTNLDKATSVIQTEDSSRDKTEEHTEGKETAKMQQSPQEHEQIVYLSGTQEGNPFDASKHPKQKRTNEKPKVGKLTKLKGSIISFFRSRDNSSIDVSKSPRKTTNVRKSSKNKTNSRKIDVKNQNMIEFPSSELCEGSSNGNSNSNPRKLNREEKTTERKSATRKHSRRSSITDPNPGVAQMQGFFFQT